MLMTLLQDKTSKFRILRATALSKTQSSKISTNSLNLATIII